MTDAREAAEPRCCACAGKVDPAAADLWVVTTADGPRQACSYRCARKLYGTGSPIAYPDHTPIYPHSRPSEALDVLFGYVGDPRPVPDAQEGDAA